MKQASSPGRAALGLAAALTASTFLGGCRAPLSSVFVGMAVRTQWVMGTRLTIAVPGRDPDRSGRLLRRAFAIARECDRLLSDYRPQSALSRLNRAAGTAMTPVDGRFYEFLRTSQEWSKRTHGAFDLVIGALTHRYRQGRHRPAHRRRLLVAVGNRLLLLGPRPIAGLAQMDARLDPGAIGKGYAVDQIVRFLRSRGVRRAFLNFGGSTFFGLGAPPGKRGWPVLLRSATPGRYLGVALLRDESLSSSLSRRPAGRDGRRRQPHIFDPRNGRLVTEPRFAAVVAPTATATDVLATALVVAPAATLRRLRKEAAVVQRAGRPPVWTGGFESRLVQP